MTKKYPRDNLPQMTGILIDPVDIGGKQFIFCGIKHLEPTIKIKHLEPRGTECPGLLPPIVGREQSPPAVLIVCPNWVSTCIAFCMIVCPVSIALSCTLLEQCITWSIVLIVCPGLSVRGVQLDNLFTSDAIRMQPVSTGKQEVAPSGEKSKTCSYCDQRMHPRC